LSYENSQSNNIVLLAKGNGGVTELVEHLKDYVVAYGLVRKIEQIDDSKTVKFCFINWAGENTPRMLKARIGTHRGAVNEFFSPFHVDVNCSHRNEISDDIVKNLISRTSGTESHVISQTVHSEKVVKQRGSVSTNNNLEQSTTQQQQPQTTTSQPKLHQFNQKQEREIKKTIVPSVPTEKRDVNFANEEAIKAAIKSVRLDSANVNWCLITYDAPKSKTLTLLGSGSGGLSELTSHLKDDIVGYGLLRTTEKIDESVTVKFCFINWVGENINRMQRAVLGTHSGAIKELIHPYHVDINPTKKEEITEQIITRKIKEASGTAYHVMEKN